MDSALRTLVWQRADKRCEYCRLRQAYAPFPVFHVEHVRPKKHDGGDDEHNLCIACSHCNLHKSSNLTGIDPKSDEITPLFHPRQQHWSDHFAYDGAMIIGITPVGRATVRVLNMNDEERLELRRELKQLGLLEL